MTKAKRDRGYSLRLIADVEAANPDLVGVRFGKLCISRDLPVRDMASEFEVTRATMYRWFTGRAMPRGKHIIRMLNALDHHAGSSV